MNDAVKIMIFDFEFKILPENQWLILQRLKKGPEQSTCPGPSI